MWSLKGEFGVTIKLSSVNLYAHNIIGLSNSMVESEFYLRSVKIQIR